MNLCAHFANISNISEKKQSHFLGRIYLKLPFYETCPECDFNIPGNQYPWWRHQMETFYTLLAICAGNLSVPGEFPQKGQWCGALILFLICAWINGWINNRKADDLRRNHAHYDASVMSMIPFGHSSCSSVRLKGAVTILVPPPASRNSSLTQHSRKPHPSIAFIHPIVYEFCIMHCCSTVVVLFIKS